jgi:fructose-1,6-bisphosphatase II
VAAGRNGAIAVIAIAESGSLYDPKDTFYMDKIAVGPEAGAYSRPLFSST